MTNGEKYKTAVERKDAYRKYVHQNWEVVGEFAWLELEYKEELLPCPFCGGKKIATIQLNLTSNWNVVCGECGCRTESQGKDEAIAAWNRRAK